MKLKASAAKAYLKPVLGNYSARKAVVRGAAAAVLFGVLKSHCLEGCEYAKPKPIASTPSKVFSLSLGPSSAAVLPGGSTSTVLQTRLVSGPGETVTLSAAGLAAGITTTLSTSRLKAGGTAKLKIATSNSTQAGTYPVVITAKGASSTVTTAFDLTVTPVKQAASLSGFACSSSGSTDLNCSGRLTSGQSSPGQPAPGVSNAVVTLTYSSPSGKVQIRTMRTNSTGAFSDDIDTPAGPPLEAGMWSINAGYAGDATHSAASTSTTQLVQSP